MTFAILEPAVFTAGTVFLLTTLEKDGYSLSRSEANYTVVADISCVEKMYDAGAFVRPSVDIAIVNSKGNGVYSYSKAFARVGSKTMERAYIRAVAKINQDLEENFFSE